MKLINNGENLQAAGDLFHQLEGSFNELAQQILHEEAKEAFYSAYELSLGYFVDSVFKLGKEKFLCDAYEELCHLLGLDEETELEISPLEIYLLKLGDFFGSDNPLIHQIYSNSNMIH